MIALLASIVLGAFPFRGSVVRSLDSNLVIDGDTVHVLQEQCPCMCPGSQYVVRVSRTTDSGVQPFPRTNMSYLASRSSEFLGMDASGMLTRCGDPRIGIAPDSTRRFIMRGQNASWAVWADSLYPWKDTTRRFDTTGGRINSSITINETFRARWRWSRIDSTVPWVRWIDTLKLNPGSSLVGRSVFTTLRSARLDSLSPRTRLLGSGFVLRALNRTDSEWGFRLDDPPTSRRPTPVVSIPSDSIAAGTTFAVLDAYNQSAGIPLWRMMVDGKTVDSLVTTGYAISTSVAPARRNPAQLGHQAYDLATGQRVALPHAMQVGRHLLDGPSGTRIIVVR